MAQGKQHEMPVIRENEDGMLSSGDGVATEGEEEEEDVSPERNSTTKNQEEHEPMHAISEEGEQLTPYVAKCYGHLETLRKRKREQEEQVEALVEGVDDLKTFGQIEAIMQEIMRGLQERHAASHAQFEATDSKLTHSLRAHNRMEKKLKMIAAILMREDDGEHELE